MLQKEEVLVWNIDDFMKEDLLVEEDPPPDHSSPEDLWRTTSRKMWWQKTTWKKRTELAQLDVVKAEPISDVDSFVEERRLAEEDTPPDGDFAEDEKDAGDFAEEEVLVKLG